MSGAWGYGDVLKVFLWGYFVGGLTLLPALLVIGWFFGTKIVEDQSRNDAQGEATPGQRRTPASSHPSPGEDSASLGVGLDEKTLEKLKRSTHEPDTFAGYFAVCREYVPGGVNGKPPDRLTPAGAVISMESPSVYQSMYRSIFDRNKTTSPSIDAANVRNKRARNVFYIVLRLGHLMLYDNEDQLEVRHVISLAHYRTDVYGGGDRIPEGELWIKRNCIRLVHKHEHDPASDSKSFYLFSDNCSEKEDFYHAMLHAQEHHQDDTKSISNPAPLKFDTSDLVKLVQQLHASEENLHTRWINALVGRVFLALYKTSEVKDFIANKITKKIARVPKPALISSVTLRNIDMGTLPPFLTNPKLKELTVDGDLVVEADVSYKGNFRIEIAAIARIELGTRFKAREVTLVLATILKKLDGHILIRIKPPPSNRLWLTFETPPRMELSLEPIVSSRQITYGVILRAIESRIREVLNETLVLPNWDDMPFTDTLAQAIRGGIWQKEEGETGREKEQEDVFLERATIDAEKLDEKADSASSHLSISSSLESEEIGAATSTSAEVKTSSARPRPMRSSSSAAQIQVDSANASAELARENISLTPTSVRSMPITSPVRSPLVPDTASSIAAFERTSVEDFSAPLEGSESVSIPGGGSHARNHSKELSAEDIASAAAAAAAASAGAHTPKKTMFNQSLNSATAAARNWLASKQTPQISRKPTNSHQRTPSSSVKHNSQDDDNAHADLVSNTVTEPPKAKPAAEPMGRGQPLPPPGTPLPPPARPEQRKNWAIPAAASTFANIAKRKPIASPTSHTLSEHHSKEHLFPSSSSPSNGLSHSPPKEPYDLALDATHEHGSSHHRRRSSVATTDSGGQVPRRKSSAASSTTSLNPPPLPKRRQRQQSLTLTSQHRRASQISHGEDASLGDGLFVVEAPLLEGSVPSTPVDDASDGKELGSGRAGIDVARADDRSGLADLGTGSGSGSSSSEKLSIGNVT